MTTLNYQTIAQALTYAEQAFAFSDSARLDAELLLLAAISKEDRSYLFTWPERVISDEHTKIFDRYIHRRCQHEPVAHILECAYFWSLLLKVTPDTLIPRPDTETLVEETLNLISNYYADKPGSILDLGTGTGAIALALKSELNDWQVHASDFLLEAVNLAKENALNLALDIKVYHSSWFEHLHESINSKFDIIVTNPPYIEDNDPHVIQGDVRFEPLSALTSGVDGLNDIRIIIEQSKAWLNKGGWLCIEHGYDQANRIQVLFEQQGYHKIVTIKDLNEHDRVTLGQLF